MERSLRTVAVRAGIDADRAEGAVVPPLYLSTNYRFEGLRTPRAYDYSRSGNPTRTLLSDALAELDGAAGAVVTASGMGAITTVLMAFVSAGDVVVAPHDAYGGTWRLLDALSRRIGFDLQLFDLTSPDAPARVRALASRLTWVETPSNPLVGISDLPALAEATHAAGGLLVADNTFCSPVLQRPLDFGADVVVQSSTKYLNGHSDVIAGVATAATAELAEQLRWWGNCLGTTGGAFDSYLTLRGLRTLGVRMQAHLENAAAVVDALVAHPAVERVHYPGLPDHPGHELAAKQMSGFGAIVSFEVGGGEDAVAALVDGLRHFSLAESLGGVESLVCHPSSMTHAAMPPEVQEAAGLRPGLVRLSVGIEDPGDLVADLVAGLDRAAAAAVTAR
ncbi:MAG: cystathionine gamma-synthase, partial [Propionibacteriaceae bacterium]|nr:cystathionine gamma-synthase [Propionibacteriaceae bacterium]